MIISPEVWNSVSAHVLLNFMNSITYIYPYLSKKYFFPFLYGTSELNSICQLIIFPNYPTVKSKSK